MLRDTQQGTEGHTRARLTPNPCPALSPSPPLLVWETLRLGKEKWHPTRGRARMSTAQPHSACPSWSKPLQREAPAQSPRAGLYSRPLLLGSVLFLSPPFLLLPLLPPCCAGIALPAMQKPTDEEEWSCSPGDRTAFPEEWGR